jgi:quercetin dioxygenase-like cupin family protein
MKSIALRLSVGTGLIAAILLLQGAGRMASAPATLHIVTSSQIQWSDPPTGAARGTPSVPPGSPLRYSEMEGDPLKPDKPFTIRLRCANGYRVAPHWHPVEENIIVLRGAFAVAAGDVFDPARTKDIPPGGYGFVPAGLHHFAICKGETEMIMYGVGPRLNYWVSARSR